MPVGSETPLPCLGKRVFHYHFPIKTVAVSTGQVTKPPFQLIVSKVNDKTSPPPPLPI
uniref:Uncharacterized protein n=1 Tax=Anguilla anguilla TaxID=7936 RepID=A0A0E9VPQ9_ANGAN